MKRLLVEGDVLHRRRAAPRGRPRSRSRSLAVSSRTTAFSCRARIISASSSSDARALERAPQVLRQVRRAPAAWACRASGSWWRAPQSAISNTVKSTIPTGTGCARTSDWTQPKTLETSAPLGGVSAQTSTHARTIGSGHEPDAPSRRSAAGANASAAVTSTWPAVARLGRDLRLGRRARDAVHGLFRASLRPPGRLAASLFFVAGRLFRRQGASPIWIA